MDISKKDIQKIERKSLGEDCWINLSDDVRIRIDYLTRAQEVEFNRLSIAWGLQQGDSVHSHHLEYYFRCAVKDVQGITIEGKETTLTFKHGVAQNLITENIKNDKLPEDDPLKKKPLDVVASFIGLGLFYVAVGSIFQRLEMDDADKKKLPSVQDSVKKDNLPEVNQSSNPATS